MARRLYATVGRSPDNDVVLDHPTVSNHHARLSWKGRALLVEDLSSANGTFVDGARVKTGAARPGSDVRIGELELPWSHEGLRALLKAGAGERTLVMPARDSLSFVCGRCGHVGKLQQGARPGQITCPACKATLETREKPQSAARGPSVGLWAAALMLLVAGATGYFVLARRDGGAALVPSSDVVPLLPSMREKLAAHAPGGESAQRLATALTPMDALTRNTAVKLAARNQGPFHVEQVAEIWAGVRRPWRYVNDPDGREYFATATESIGNGYVGDCDDFAVTLASMVIAIGGQARVVLMDGPKGGHAYAEACVQGEPGKVAAALTKHYKNKFRRYITGSIPKTIAYRSSEACPIWLNLDWSAAVPGGPYESEHWAVAVYEGGRTEQLAPANPVPATDAKRSPAANSAAP
jgi:hypothetical protein